MGSQPSSMEALWNALHGYLSPITVVYYPDLGLREPILDQVRMLADLDWEVAVVNSIEELFEADSEAMVLFVPSDEVAAVEGLAGARDNFVEREVPIVLFLLRGREGAKALAANPSLASWVRGSAVDPEELAEVDVEAERADFEEQIGVTPEAWLRDHRDTGAQSLSELSTTYWALLLEEQEQEDVG